MQNLKHFEFKVKTDKVDLKVTSVFLFQTFKFCEIKTIARAILWKSYRRKGRLTTCASFTLLFSRTAAISIV